MWQYLHSSTFIVSATILAVSFFSCLYLLGLPQEWQDRGRLHTRFSRLISLLIMSGLMAQPYATIAWAISHRPDPLPTYHNQLPTWSNLPEFSQPQALNMRDATPQLKNASPLDQISHVQDQLPTELHPFIIDAFSTELYPTFDRTLLNYPYPPTSPIHLGLATLMTATQYIPYFANGPISTTNPVANTVWGEKTVLGIVTGDAGQIGVHLDLSLVQTAAISDAMMTEQQAIDELKAEASLIINNENLTLEEKQEGIAAMNYNSRLQAILTNTAEGLQNSLGNNVYNELVAYAEERFEDMKQQTARMRSTERAAAATNECYETTVWGTRSTYNDYSVDLPDKELKFANRGTPANNFTGYENPPYSVSLEINGVITSGIIITDVAPSNHDDNYWREITDPIQPRRWGIDLALGQPQAEAAFFDDHNNGENQFGEPVGNPAAISLSQPVADALGVGNSGLFTVTVSYDWDCDGPSRVNRTLGLDTFTSYVAEGLNAVTGNQFHWFRDFLVSGIGLNVDFTRYYNAQSPSNGIFGPRWSTIYDMNLFTYSNGVKEITYADGRKGYFTPDDNGGYIAEAGVFEILTDHNGGYRLETRDKLFYEFDSAGHLIAIADENSNTISLTYTGGKLTSIVDTSGRNFTLTYNGDGLVSQVNDPAGRTFAYAYSGDKLIGATDANGNTTTYDYGGNGDWLTTVTDPDGVIYIQNSYNDSGQVITQQDAISVRAAARGVSAPETTMEYDAANNRSVKTDALGNQTIYYYDEQFRLIREEDALGHEITYEYDENDNMTSKTDKRGVTWYYYYDDRGNMIRKVDPVDTYSALYYKTDVTYYAYDENNYRTSVTDALGHTTTYEYDDKGNVTKIVEPNGATTTSIYNDKGLMTSMTDALGRTTTYEYDADGNRTKITDALNNVTSFTYDDTSNMLTRTDALGRTTTHQYDNSNNMTSMTDAVGNTTTFEYNAKNWRTKMIDRRGNEWLWEYDDNGNITKEIDPLGREVTYTYDAMNNRLSMTNARGNTTTYEYDALYRMIATTDAAGNRTTNTYDPNGNLLHVIDAAGEKVVELVYDSNNRRKYAYDALGGVTEYCYDPLDRMIRMFDARRAKTDFIYDNVGNLVEIHDPLAYVTAFEYDLAHNRTATIDQNGHRTESVFDELNRVEETINAIGGSITTEYDAVSNVTKMTDPMGYSTSYVYDDLNRLETETNELNQVVAYAYDPEGNMLSITDADGVIVETNVYDVANRLINITDALGNTSSYTYDENSNLLTETNAIGTTIITFEYDELDLLTSETDALGNTTSYEYDVIRRPVKVTDPLNNSTQFVYDALGHLIEVIDARGQSTHYEYDVVGNRTAIEDSNGNRTEFDYNFLNQLRFERNALGDKWTFGYDPVGNIVLQVNAEWQAIGYEYDALNRVTQASRGSTGEIVEYTYDANSNPLTMTDWNGVNTTTYDELNRPISVTDYNSRTISYGFDDVGNVTEMVYPDGRSLTMSYDDNYNLSSLTDPHGRDTTWAYNPLNLVTQRENPNSTGITYNYDVATRLTKLTNDGPSQAISSYEFTLDAVGNSSSVLENRQSWSQDKLDLYTYDELYRLTNLKSLDGVDIDYVYDSVGNRLLMDGVPEKLPGQSDPDPISVDYVHNEINSLLQADQTSFSYNNNGARTQKATPIEATEYVTVAYGMGIYTATLTTDNVYNYEDQLVHVSTYISATDGTTLTLPVMEAAYTYDGFGNRVTKQVTTTVSITEALSIPTVLYREYVYAGINVVAEYESWENSDNPDVENYYYYGNQGLIMMDRQENSDPIETFWYHIDGLGSTIAMSDEAGNVVFEVDYDVYGNLLNEDNFGLSRYNFSGEEYDEETGLIHYYARYYDTETGTWVSQDSFRGIYEQTQTLNRYAYVMNNPTNHVDFAGYGLRDWFNDNVYEPYIEPVVEETKEAYDTYVKPVVDHVNEQYVEPLVETVKEEVNSFVSNPREYVNDRVIEPVKAKYEEVKQDVEQKIQDTVEKVRDVADWIQENKDAVAAGVGLVAGFAAGFVAAGIFCAATAGIGCAIMVGAGAGLLAGGLASGGTQMFANVFDRDPNSSLWDNVGRASLIGGATGLVGGGLGGATQYLLASNGFNTSKIVKNVGNEVKSEIKDTINEGIYEFFDTDEQRWYVGQSKDINRRLKEHRKKGRMFDDSTVSRTRVLGGKFKREIAEQNRINEFGGIDYLANQVNPIGPKRVKRALQEGLRRFPFYP